MKRRELITLIGGVAAAWPLAARAQRDERVRRIGVLMAEADDPDTNARLAGFRQGLERLGWSEGHNVRMEIRFAPAGPQVQVLAKELVALRPDVILAQATPATTALQRASSEVPVVFVNVADPIGSGFVTSLARPGGNLTGLLLFETSIGSKWLAMLKKMAPHLTRALLYSILRRLPILSLTCVRPRLLHQRSQSSLYLVRLRTPRPIHAGCRSGSLRTSPELIPKVGSTPGSDIV